MAKVEASAERTIDAPAEQVYGHLADMHQHPRFLPPAFSDFKVEEGGAGAGTVTSFKVTAGGRTRDYLMRIATHYMSREEDLSKVLTYSLRVLDVMEKKGKPEAVTAEDWQKKKIRYLGGANWMVREATRLGFRIDAVALAGTLYFES